jgi:hypothetical protein
VVHGRRDPFFPVGNGEALAREIPGARLLVLEEAATATPMRPPVTSRRRCSGSRRSRRYGDLRVGRRLEPGDDARGEGADERETHDEHGRHVLVGIDLDRHQELVRAGLDTSGHGAPRNLTIRIDRPE